MDRLTSNLRSYTSIRRCQEIAEYICDEKILPVFSKLNFEGTNHVSLSSKMDDNFVWEPRIRLETIQGARLQSCILNTATERGFSVNLPAVLCVLSAVVCLLPDEH